MTTNELTSHIIKFGGEARLTKWPKKVLWGVAPTGAPHFGYAGFVALLKLLASNGVEVVLLVANYHGFLDSEKIRKEAIPSASNLYKSTFTDLGIRNEWVVETNSFYFTREYIEGLVAFSAHFKVFDILDAGWTTLKRRPTRDRTFGDVFYVATQIFDVKYLDVDCVLCGQDEADIYRFGLPTISRLIGEDVDYIYLSPAPGIYASEMHASDPADNKLSLSASQHEIADAFARSSKLARYHLDFTLPMLNAMNPAANRDSSQAIHNGLRMRI